MKITTSRYTTTPPTSQVMLKLCGSSPKRITGDWNNNKPNLPFSPPVKKLRILHDRCNPFLIDKLFQIIVEKFPLPTLQNAALVSKRWHLFACNRLNKILFNQEASSMSEEDLDDAVNGLEKIKDMVNLRLLNLSRMRRTRTIEEFYHWRDNGKVKKEERTLPWLHRLRAVGFPFQRFCTAEDIFRWVMENDDMDDGNKGYWVKQLVNTNVQKFLID